LVVVAAMRLMMTSWLISGLPRQFWAYKGKQTVFDLVPFAGARWKVTDRDFKSCFVG
jgi:hypothetical protein